MARICIFGDSIARGNSDYIYGGWGQLLSNYTERNFEDLSIYNLSVDGETSREILNRFQQEASHREPYAVIFAYGTNDSAILSSSKENQVSQSQFVENTKALIELAQTLNLQVVFLGLLSVNEEITNPIPWDEERNYHNQELQTYNRLLKNICEECECVFIDVIHEIESRSLPDGLHPDTQAHQKLFEIIKTTLIDKKIIPNK